MTVRWFRVAAFLALAVAWSSFAAFILHMSGAPNLLAGIVVGIALYAALRPVTLD